MENATILIAYSIYSLFVVGLTLFVSGHLFKSGKAFMMDIFNNREAIADSINKLFQIGYFLFGLGIGFVLLETHREFLTTQTTIEVMSMKFGQFAIILGVILFAYMFLFFRGKKVSSLKRLQQPTKEDDIEDLSPAH